MRAVRPAGRRLAVLIAAAALIGSCSDPVEIEDYLDLTSAQKRWEQVVPQDYSFTLFRRCYCWIDSPMRITVHGDSITSIVLLGPEVIPPGRKLTAPTVSGLFDIIMRALSQNAAKVSVHYDHDLGFPHSLYVDWYEDYADDEIRYIVTDVTFAPPD